MAEKEVPYPDNPSQGHPANQGYPNQGYPNQGYPNQGYPNQGYPSTAATAPAIMNNVVPQYGAPGQQYRDQCKY